MSHPVPTSKIKHQRIVCFTFKTHLSASRKLRLKPCYNTQAISSKGKCTAGGLESASLRQKLRIASYPPHLCFRCSSHTVAAILNPLLRWRFPCCSGSQVSWSPSKMIQIPPRRSHLPPPCQRQHSSMLVRCVPQTAAAFPGLQLNKNSGSAARVSA